VWTSVVDGTEEDWHKEAAFWKKAGATHLCLTTTFNGRARHKRIAGRNLGDHLAAAKRYRDVIGDLL
jgi:hypothetical protein